MNAISFQPETLRKDFPILQQEIHKGRPLVYFDNAATTQRPTSVIRAITDCYENHYSNVHRGIHALSERSTSKYEQAREAFARFVGARKPHEVIFTTGTTLAINTVARSWGDANINSGDLLVVTEMEHHTNLVPWQQLAQRRGARVAFAPIDDQGQLDRAALKQLLEKQPKLVAITAVSNVLGTINPVKEIAEQVHQAGGILVVDGAQHAPHEPMDVADWDADFVVVSGHKMLGPSGIGILYGRESLLEAMPPFLGGGSMIRTVDKNGFTPGELPAKFEAGTPPIVSAIAMTAAIDYLERVGVDQIGHYEKVLAERAMSRLAEIEGLTIHGPPLENRCGIVSFTVSDVSPQDISLLIDRKGFAIRAGHHCAMPLHERLGVPASCRASFYLYNTLDEVDRFADALGEVLTKLR